MLVHRGVLFEFFFLIGRITRRKCDVFFSIDLIRRKVKGTRSTWMRLSCHWIDRTCSESLNLLVGRIVECACAVVVVRRWWQCLCCGEWWILRFIIYFIFYSLFVVSTAARMKGEPIKNWNFYFRSSVSSRRMQIFFIPKRGGKGWNFKFIVESDV